jgi:hypothetical protein
MNRTFPAFLAVSKVSIAPFGPKICSRSASWRSRSSGVVLQDQQAFFSALREQVGAIMTILMPDEAKDKVEMTGRPRNLTRRLPRFVTDRGARSEDRV